MFKANNILIKSIKVCRGNKNKNVFSSKVTVTGNCFLQTCSFPIARQSNIRLTLLIYTYHPLQHIHKYQNKELCDFKRKPKDHARKNIMNENCVCHRGFVLNTGLKKIPLR